MRVGILMAGVWLASIGTATAFNCNGVSHPWDIVVCSDPELRHLADQRLEAFEQAETRLTQSQIDQLRSDQNAWVRSYSAACGIPADRPPPIPIPAAIIECFKRSGEARLSYLRNYGISSALAQIAPSASAAVSETIPMLFVGGTYTVPVAINGALTLRFVVDSGASDVVIPADVVLTLARTGTITDSDFIGDQTYTLADRSTLKSARFRLGKLQVGDQVVYNAAASIGPVESVPLLGQSFLSHFLSWTLDNQQHALVLGQPLSALPAAAQQPSEKIDYSAVAIPSKALPKLTSSKRWLVVASSGDLKAAIAIAKEYKRTFPETLVVRSTNGQYGVTLGRFDVGRHPSLFGKLLETGRIPKGSYLTLGSRFLSIEWR